MPIANINSANSNLKNLRVLLQQSEDINVDIHKLISRLRNMPVPAKTNMYFQRSLVQNRKILSVIFADCADLRLREFNLAGRRALLIYIDGLTDTKMLERTILAKALCSQEQVISEKKIAKIIEQILTPSAYTIAIKIAAAVQQIMMGNALIVVDGFRQTVVVDSAEYVKRGIEESKSENIVRGAHDGFNETLRDNIVLIRRRTKDTNLKVKIVDIGQRSQTSVAVVYVDNLAQSDLVEEVLRKLAAINIDRLVLSYNIQEYITPRPWPLFPTIQGTERPDVVVAGLYEGRVAIIMDNTPWALIVPYTYNTAMQSVDDYAMQVPVASAVRMIRHFAVLVTVYLPALYISIVSFNPGMLPTALAIYIAELRARAPFPTAVEAFIMVVILEVFQEAIVRLPNRMVIAASVVGGLVIGTTVAQAGLVNPLLVVVISGTAIASYAMTSYNFAMGLRLARFIIIIIASVLGLYGVILGTLVLLVYMCSLESFGQSFMGGFLQVDTLADWRDSLVRLSIKNNPLRPKIYGAQDETRIGGYRDGKQND